MGPAPTHRPPAAVVLVLALAVAFAGACTSGGADPSPGDDASPRIVTVALAEELAGFNVSAPEHASDAARRVAVALWPSAYRIRPDGTPEPWLLSAPAAVVSSDPFTVEWRIRADANWSDGTPVTSEDFEHLYRHCAGLVEGAPCADPTGYDRVRRFDKVDPKTVRLTFSRPYVDFPALFRHVPPAHVVTERGGDWVEALAGDPGASAGPFRFVEWRRGEAMVLERNDTYFGERAHVDRLVVRFVAEATLADALRSGDVDVVSPAAPTLDLVGVLQGIDDAAVKAAPGPEAHTLVFNVRNPTLAVPGVRRAVALAVDRDTLVRVLVRPVHGAAARQDDRVFLTQHAAYRAHGEEFARRDLDRARAELAATGWAPDPDGVYAQAGQRLEFRIATASGDARREEAVQLLQTQLDELGVRVHIANAPDDRLDAMLAAGDFELALVARRPGPLPTGATVASYATGGAGNRSGLSEPRVDELLELASREPDDEGRMGLLHEVDVALWGFLPDLPLYQPPVVVAHDVTLNGVAVNPWPEGVLWNVEEWRFAPREG